jgi:hypothetical protein
MKHGNVPDCDDGCALPELTSLARRDWTFCVICSLSTPYAAAVFRFDPGTPSVWSHPGVRIRDRVGDCQTAKPIQLSRSHPMRSVVSRP